jgi:hypothetical protein
MRNSAARHSGALQTTIPTTPGSVIEMKTGVFGEIVRSTDETLHAIEIEPGVSTMMVMVAANNEAIP